MLILILQKFVYLYRFLVYLILMYDFKKQCFSYKVYKNILKNFFVIGIIILIFKNYLGKINLRLFEYRKEDFLNLGVEFRVQNIEDEIIFFIF